MSQTGLFPEITISHNIYFRPKALLIYKIVNDAIKSIHVETKYHVSYMCTRSNDILDTSCTRS